VPNAKRFVASFEACDVCNNKGNLASETVCLTSAGRRQRWQWHSFFAPAFVNSDLVGRWAGWAAKDERGLVQEAKERKEMTEELAQKIFSLFITFSP